VNMNALAPPKRSAPAREIAGAAKLRLIRTYHDRNASQGCQYARTVTEQMPRGHVHYTRKVCEACGTFIRWLPKPETVERQRLNAFRLARLAMQERLSAWERNFIRDAAQRKKLTPRQQEIVDELAATHLKGEAP
jgi:hypothetical protein